MSGNDADEDAVLNELGGAAEGAATEAGNTADSASPAPQATAQEGAQGEVTGEPAAGASTDAAVTDDGGVATGKKQTRQRRKTRAEKQAEGRAASQKRMEEAEAAREAAEAAAGVANTTVVDADLSQIPVDDDGNPLWYFNPKTQRVVKANRTLHRPDIRRRMKLLPCQPPKEAVEADSESPA